MLLNVLRRYPRKYQIHARLLSCAALPPLPLEPAEPGTVKTYTHHILLRVPPGVDETSSDAVPPNNKSQSHGPQWWPAKVEGHPTVVKTFSTLASHKAALGDIIHPKITLWDTLAPSKPLDADRCDAMFFPDAALYKNINLSDLTAVIEKHVFGSQAHLPLDVQRQHSPLVSTLTLFVCSHGSRDSRCGCLGPLLVAALASKAKELGIEQNIMVLPSSHIGGHKMAGNVVVYMPKHPCDGDWFGGLNADNAGAFLEALVNVEFGVDGGAGDTFLREFWRGRIRLTKEEQRELFELGGRIDEGEEDGSDGDEEGDWEEDAEIEVKR